LSNKITLNSLTTLLRCRVESENNRNSRTRETLIESSTDQANQALPAVKHCRFLFCNWYVLQSDTL